MPKFTITCYSPVTLEERDVIYDTDFSTLQWADTLENVMDELEPADQPDMGQMKLGLGKNPKTVKIQLGLECNFACEYCSQRFVPRSDSHNKDDIMPFVEGMKDWFKGGDDGEGEGAKFEFWGGEPLVYWKTLKPLAEELKKRYPNAQLSMITNGSLLDEEKVHWLDEMGFGMSISHDGPGQHVRGPDPLQDPDSKKGILDVYKLLAPKGKISFNAMINKNNISRNDIQVFFEKFIEEELGEEYVDYLTIGEGTFIDAYDDGGLANSLENADQDTLYRWFSLKELRDFQPKRFTTIRSKVSDWIRSIKYGMKSENMGQKCGMDKIDNIAVDLDGNVLTCQNVSSVSISPAGVSHKIGHVSDLDAVKIDTGFHWSDREECPSCPVLHLCKGSCLFLSGPLWEASCNNAFSDNLVMLCMGMEMLTGMIPKYIEGPQREDRKDIFWHVNGEPAANKKRFPSYFPKADSKVIPIKAI